MFSMHCMNSSHNESNVSPVQVNIKHDVKYDEIKIHKSHLMIGIGIDVV